MKNSYSILVLVTAIIAGTAFFSLAINRNNTPQLSGDVQKKAEMVSGKSQELDFGEDVILKEDQSGIGEVKSRYVEYSQSALDQSAVNRRVLYFYASWCLNCRSADTDFRENENKIPEDVTVLRVNYNDPETDQEEKELAQKYGITYEHTFVQINNNGEVITKWNGGQIEELLANINM